MNRHFVIPLLFTFCFFQTGCGESKPSKENAKQAIKAFLNDQGRPVSEVSIVRVGERGQGDFSAPGSQDSYWPVEFESPGTRVSDAGPLQVSASPEHEVAKVYRDKLGTWKVAPPQR